MQITQQPTTPVLLENLADTTSLLLKFREDVPNPQRRPLNVALVIDRSGSMAGAPLRYALQAAANFVDRLTADDRLSIVVYDDVVSTLLDAQLVTDKDGIKRMLQGVRAGGLTNLSGGWLQGCELVAKHKTDQHVNRVLLLTDGQANNGITNPAILINTAAKKAEEGITTTTLGFGSHFEEDLLIGMARAAAGNFYFIQSLDDAADVFGIELDSLKAIAAQNLTVTLTPINATEIGDVLSLARQEAQSDGRMVLHLGDVYENEDKVLGLQLRLPALPTGAHQLLHVAYRADAIRNGSIEAIAGEHTVQVTAGSIEAVAVASDGGVMLELARLRIARDKERAVDLADAGKHAEAEALLHQLVAELTAKGLHEHFEIAEEIDQINHYAQRIASRHLDNESRKELRDQAFQGRRARVDLAGRGVSVDQAAHALPVVSEPGTGVELVCFREGGKLRVRVVSAGFDDLNIQFPRAIRAEGAHYIVEELERSADGTFYRAKGTITRLVRPGETDPLAGGHSGSSRSRSTGSTSARAAKPAATLADLEETDTIGSGILIQCVKDGSKLRARVVSDGFDPNWNMRFPRGIRDESTLFVVEQVNTAPDGKSYIASGEIKKFVQTT
ncbi:vWA domain-containing protein [Hymenobacter chitinivorans]|uniref:Ca-activated chloride channel family protein n=1 Tax=Hymenobacter chitinivorans DSM 11115 TaxID=1121954 RepID=A0A2M9B569_9BACT|nr:VWA domain-containing protein [Hymenobacter chitinivorans]PJJ53074.1 Ca-activated chloride channel family protein [Hymenobacter chitinivorans DSM 11115]